MHEDKKDPNKNFAAQGARQMMRRMHGLRSGIFTVRDYRRAMDQIDADVIYLDPPYADTSSYVGVEPFDSAKFWQEVRKRSDGKRRILVSEYKAPADFTAVSHDAVTDGPKHQVRLIDCRRNCARSGCLSLSRQRVSGWLRSDLCWRDNAV